VTECVAPLMSTATPLSGPLGQVGAMFVNEGYAPFAPNRNRLKENRIIDTSRLQKSDLRRYGLYPRNVIENSRRRGIHVGHRDTDNLIRELRKSSSLVRPAAVLAPFIATGAARSTRQAGPKSV
jgi:hypothetical protein